MPVIDFPSNPSNNELFIAQGKAMRYNSDKNKWKQVTTLTQGQVTSLENNTIGVASMSISGNTLVIQKDNGTHANVSLASFAGNILTNYASASNLPLTGLVSGTQVYVEDTDSLFITDGSGWFKVATVNLSPSLSLGVSSISLAPGGSIDVNYTINEPEDTPYTISASATSSATITVHQSNNTITFDTPTTTATETITISATDGVNTVGDTLTMTISLEPNWANLTQQARLNPTPEVFGYFGLSFGLSGDNLAVGAPANVDIGSNAGKGYIFNRSGSTWSQEKTITSSDHQAGDRLGESVDISGNTAVFTATLGGRSGNKGAAYVFTKGGGWSGGAQMEMLKASNTGNDDQYGWDISISNDGNYAAVGAKQEDTGGSNRGSVYIYVKSGTTWTEQARIQSSDIANGDQFGVSVALNSDGTTLVVGAWFDDSNGQPGSAYVFTRSGTSWSQQAKIDPNDYTNDTWYFGNSCDITDDGNTVIISSPYAKVGSNSAQGAAYIFNRSGTTWSQQGKLTASDGAANDAFSGDIMGVGDSHAVGISGDGNYAIVGAPYDDDGGEWRGTAFIYYKSGSTWSQQQKIQSTGLINKAYFGWGVAIDEDGDTVVVGANHNSYSNATDRKGKAFIWTRSGTTWSQQAELQHSDANSYTTAAFGYGVDIDGSGDKVFIGARNISAVYAYERSGTTWTEVKKHIADNAGPNDQRLGAAVSVSSDGKYFIAGCVNEDTNGPNTGAAYIFSNTGWSEQAIVQPSPINNDERFGQKVVIHGDAMAVSSRFNINGNVGAVYYFTRSGSTWTQQQKISPPPGTSVEQYFGVNGLDFSTNGYMVIGADYWTPQAGYPMTGGAYIYKLSGTTWSLQQTISADLTKGAYQQFGHATSINDDGDVAVITAPGAGTGGEAFIYTRSGTTWSLAQTITSSDIATADTFGSGASIDGKSIVIGAFGDDDGGASSGSAYVFRYNGTSWVQVKKLVAADATEDDQLTREGSLVIDATTETIVAGARNAVGSNGVNGAGKVIVFTI